MIDAWFCVPIYRNYIIPTKDQDFKIERFFYKYCQDFGHLLDGGIHNVTGDITGLIKISELDEFKWINSDLCSHVNNFLRQIGVDVSEHMIHIQKSWPVVCDTNGSVSPHNHKNAHISAVYYFKCDSDNGGDIEFHCPPYHPILNLPVMLENNSTVRYTPEKNLLLIFPSSLEHRVTKYIGKDFRFSISYDIMITSKKDSGLDTELIVTHPSMWTVLGD